MIRVNNDYIIDIDSLNYAVKLDTHRKKMQIDHVTGEKKVQDLYVTVGYFSDLTGAVKGVIADMNNRGLRNGAHTLEEAIALVIENNRHVSELLERALEV